MTSAPGPSSEDLREAATSLAHQAERLRHGVGASHARVRGAAWRTPWRSEAFRAAYEERGRRGEALAARLDDLAAALRREADERERDERTRRAQRTEEGAGHPEP